MLDLGRIVAVVAVLLACGRARSVVGFVLGALIASMDATTMIAPLLSRTAPADAGHAFVLAFWGPSKMPMPPVSIGWIDAALMRYPTIVPLATALLAATGAIHAFRRAAPMRPETERARVLDQLGLRFMLVAVLDGILFIVGLMTSHFLANVV